MSGKIKLWVVLGIILFTGFLGCGKDKRDISVISYIDLGTTNTNLHLQDGSKISDYDLRVSVRTKEATEVQVQSLTVTTPSGASFTCERNDKGAIDQKDPQYGIEVIREFERDGNEGVWTLAAIANLEYELFVDGIYTITAQYVTQPMTSPITFKWKSDPVAQKISVFFAGGGRTKSDQFQATTTSFGPFEYASGPWELELVITVERTGTIDRAGFTISKGTVYSAEGVVE
jgi:hypothetical protein